jgi:hypothetical protein
MVFHFTQILASCLRRMRTVSLFLMVWATAMNRHVDVGDFFFFCKVFYCDKGIFIFTQSKVTYSYWCPIIIL